MARGITDDVVHHFPCSSASGGNGPMRDGENYAQENPEEAAGNAVRSMLSSPNQDNSLVVQDESRLTKFPFSFVVLSWGELG